MRPIMSKMHRLQRGAADIVAVAVGLTILAIATIGTSTALVYGREALVQQEHYKVAAYQLRGVMEEEIAHIQMNIGPDQQGYYTAGRYLNFETIGIVLDSPHDRGGAIYQTVGEITRDNVETYPSGTHPMWGVMTLRATWREAVVSGVPSGQPFNLEGPPQTIVMTAPFLFRGAL
jgi:hypothetical protein